MTKLSDLIKKENYFTTIDGRTLKTVIDLKEYLSTCSENDYVANAAFFKEYIVLWVKNILVIKELSEDLSKCTTLAQAIDVMNLFVVEFDYQSKRIPDDKAFHTSESFNIKNLQELFYYVNNCSEADFNYYVNSIKNDFANWVNDVLLFPILASKMRTSFTQSDMILLLRGFLTNDMAYGDNSEYERYINERLIRVTKSETVSKLQETILQEKIPEKIKELSKSEKAFKEFSSDTPVDVPMDVPKSSSVSELKLVTEKKEETIDLSIRPDLERKEELEKVPPKEFDTSGFKQFTDEELEKFIAFSKKEVALDPNPKIEYLKSVLQELTNMVRDLRRIEKDPLVAELMLRTVSAKIDYYVISNNMDDYNHIIRLFKEVQHEIEESATLPSYNLAEEIYNDLKFQAITLKKS